MGHWTRARVWALIAGSGHAGCGTDVGEQMRLLILPIVMSSVVTASADAPGEQSFLADNRAAMATMMAGMAITPTGDVDRDFVAMMVPHHQGAIDMAVALLRHGHNERLKRLAQEIIVTQQEEIAAMRLAVGENLPPPVASPTQADRAVPDTLHVHSSIGRGPGRGGG